MEFFTSLSYFSHPPFTNFFTADRDSLTGAWMSGCVGIIAGIASHGNYVKCPGTDWALCLENIVLHSCFKQVLYFVVGC